MAFCGGLLVEALQRAVMALVQPPTSLDRGTRLTKFLQCQPIGLDRTLQQARVNGTEAQPGLTHDPARGFGLSHTLFSEGYVVPAREEIEGVPRALAVAEEDQSAGHGAMVGPSRLLWLKDEC